MQLKPKSDKQPHKQMPSPLSKEIKEFKDLTNKMMRNKAQDSTEMLVSKDLIFLEVRSKESQ